MPCRSCSALFWQHLEVCAWNAYKKYIYIHIYIDRTVSGMLILCQTCRGLFWPLWSMRYALEALFWTVSWNYPLSRLYCRLVELCLGHLAVCPWSASGNTLMQMAESSVHHCPSAETTLIRGLTANSCQDTLWEVPSYMQEKTWLACTHTHNETQIFWSNWIYWRRSNMQKNEGSHLTLFLLA